MASVDTGLLVRTFRLNLDGEHLDVEHLAVACVPFTREFYQAR